MNFWYRFERYSGTDWCATLVPFRRYYQHTNYYDPDYSGAYSIKEYSSVKSYDECGNWQHEKIELRPLNKEFNPIILTPDDGDEFRVIGEFVDTLDV